MPNSPLIQRAALQSAIVDLDGTMVDTMGDFVVAINAVLDELALPSIGHGDVERMVGKGSEHLLRSVLDHVGGDAGLYDKAWAAYQVHYMRVNGKHSDVFPGVEDGLRALADRGLKLACLTNKPTDFAVQLLTEKGLRNYFDVVFGGDAFPVKKPDPLPLIETCKSLGTEPARTLMIGDSSNDAQAARAAGCPVLLMTYGYNHGQPIRGVDADGYFDSLADLAKAI